MADPLQSVPIFADRAQAGAALADRLLHYAGHEHAIVLALPRGGVPVGHEIALRLRIPLDVFAVRKLGVPGQPELAMGAIATGDIVVLNRDLIDYLGITPPQIEVVAHEASTELARQAQAFRGDAAPPPIAGQVVILVDDGLATGSTMKAAVQAVRQRGPARVVIAVPVASREASRELGELVDEIVCLATPEPFGAVGAWYADFSQTTDDEVRARLIAPRAP